MEDLDTKVIVTLVLGALGLIAGAMSILYPETFCCACQRRGCRKKHRSEKTTPGAGASSSKGSPDKSISADTRRRMVEVIDERLAALQKKQQDLVQSMFVADVGSKLSLGLRTQLARIALKEGSELGWEHAKISKVIKCVPDTGDVQFVLCDGDRCQMIRRKFPKATSSES